MRLTELIWVKAFLTLTTLVGQTLGDSANLVPAHNTRTPQDYQSRLRLLLGQLH